MLAIYRSGNPKKTLSKTGVAKKEEKRADPLGNCLEVVVPSVRERSLQQITIANT